MPLPTMKRAGDLRAGDRFAHEYMTTPQTVRTTKKWVGTASGAYLGQDMVTVRTDEGHTIRMGRSMRVTIEAPATPPAAAPASDAPPAAALEPHEQAQLVAALDQILDAAEGPLRHATVRDLMAAAFTAGAEWAGRR
jgi:hypothetical protein